MNNAEGEKKYIALVNSGDHRALRAAMEKGQRGEELCIAFIGGSITEGYSSTSREKSYAARIHAWWEKEFPQSRVKYVNAGIGGTGSEYGVARVEKEVLVHRPDVVFVDFSVNDYGNEYHMETYEGLLRRILMCESHPAPVLLHFIKFDDGATAQEQHLAVGRHYGLPCFSTESSLYRQLQDGVLKPEDFTADMLHPNDSGHERIAGYVTEFLEQIKKEPVAQKSAASLPEPLTANAFEAARWLQHADYEAELKGFVKDEKEKEYPADHFRGGWVGHHAGDEIRFRFTGSEAAVQFRRTIKRPAPVALAIVDGDEENAIILDANFDQDWGDNLSVVPLLRHGCIVTGQCEKNVSPARYQDSAVEKYKDVKPAAKEHEVVIRILGNPEELGWKMGELLSGGPAWIKSEGTEGAASFDLLSFFVSGPTQLQHPLSILKLQPQLMERIWGGERLKTEWGYESEKDKELGECWAISCNDQADSAVKEGFYAGVTLSKLWKEETQLFGNRPEETFPLLVKIIDAKDNLSIQVHPEDSYAKEHENSKGKRECWYILDCPADGELIVGNKAKDKAELIRMIDEERWDDLLNRIPVQPGDFVQIDPGTLHAITAGVMLLEVQQNSDVTYRVYDYGRLQNGKPRALHLQQSKDVTNAPNLLTAEHVVHTQPLVNTVQKLVETPDYKVWTLKVEGKAENVLSTQNFLLASVIEGEGCIDSVQVKKGDHLIIPKDYPAPVFLGNMRINLATAVM